MELTNSKIPSARKMDVRICTVQWEMHELKSQNHFIDKVEKFAKTASEYRADAVLFPEFLNAPLMNTFRERKAEKAIEKLAKNAPKINELTKALAKKYNINIIAGSVPEIENGTLYNVANLFHRDGRHEKQKKIHLTPDERTCWNLEGGDAVTAFDTDFGKVGILICYDVEFPELGRILAEERIEILFVPYWTDTRSGYQRVRHCAQARAIENECYVVLSGNTGNLPEVTNMDTQYAQNCILTPSDYGFPHDCVAAEATPQIEMPLFADLDMNQLERLHEKGSVKNLKDRRTDLYNITHHNNK